jgi:hypothetical protein
VDLSQVHWHIAKENPSASLPQLQNETLATIRFLVSDGLVELGDVSKKGGSFVPWHRPLDESLQRICEDYVTHFEDRRMWVAACWLRLTVKGKHTAKSLVQKYQDSLR